MVTSNTPAPLVANEIFFVLNAALFILSLVICVSVSRPFVVLFALELAFAVLNTLLLVAWVFVVPTGAVAPGALFMIVLGVSVLEGVVGLFVVVALFRWYTAGGEGGSPLTFL